MKITPQTFYKYFLCPHWVWFEVWGDQSAKGEMSALRQKLLEQGLHHEEEYIKDRTDVEVVTAEDTDEAFLQTLEFMKKGADVIWQGRLESENWVGIPDLLERRKGRSKLGAWHYVPVDIKSSGSLKKEHRLQLTLYSILLERLQGKRPSEACIINRLGERICFSIDDHVNEFEEVLGTIEKIMASPDPPPPFLTKKCLESPWGKECIRLAEEGRDIALLYRVDRKSLVALRDAGIKTLDDVRKMRPHDVARIVPQIKESSLERMQLQAESLVEKKWFLRKHKKIPESPVELYFDIEGDPLYGVEYLFGVLVEPQGEYHAFVAEKLDEEEKMWREFLVWLETLPEEYIVYHFASYEKGRLTMLSERYGGSKALDRFYDNLFDLYDVVTSCLVLPVYFYGLKDIAKLLGFRWRNKQASGAQSIFWYEEWVDNGDRKILDTIVEYNEDDVRATKFMKEWLVEAMKEGVGAIDKEKILKRVNAT